MNQRQMRIGEAAKMLNVTTQTLRNWEKSGKLIPKRSAGRQRYYLEEDVKKIALDIAKLGLAWAASAVPPELPPEYYCERSDRFTSRVAKMGTELQRSGGLVPERLASLITLIAGEIGDNSFAHNVGNWPDVLGVFFAYDIGKKVIVLADRGRGVKATLQKIRPNLVTDIVALHVAFTEIVSGRDPEKRGNGLKVVRRIAESERIGLFFRSGVGVVTIPTNPGPMQVKMAGENIRGTYTVISF